MIGVRSELAQAAEIEAAYARERARLVRLAYLLSGSRELAEDVVQTVFAEVHERWFHIDDPPAYLRRAVTNRVRDTQRRQYRRPRSLAVATVTGDVEIDEMWARVQQLGPAQRAVVVLHFYEDLSLVEVSRLLGRRPATVRSDLHRALHILKRRLE